MVENIFSLLQCLHTEKPSHEAKSGRGLRKRARGNSGCPGLSPDLFFDHPKTLTHSPLDIMMSRENNPVDQILPGEWNCKREEFGGSFMTKWLMWFYFLVSSLCMTVARTQSTWCHVLASKSTPWIYLFHFFVDNFASVRVR